MATNLRLLQHYCLVDQTDRLLRGPPHQRDGRKSNHSVLVPRVESLMKWQKVMRRYTLAGASRT